MPWHTIDGPSLPLGILRSVTASAGLPAPTQYHANLRWVEFLMSRTAGAVGPPQYQEIAENGIWHGLGDWVFTGVLHDDPDFGVAGLARYSEEKGVKIDNVWVFRQHAADFIDLAVKEILELSPALVGFSTTFMQNVPSLAAAKRLKEVAPEVAVVFGGGNCDGPMGAAIHRNFRFVDYVVSGEAEDAWAPLLRALDGDGSLAEVPGLVWRDDGVQRRNPPGGAVPAARLPVPDFGDYFERLSESPTYEYVEPKLVVETARGCWWGEKHHCTFCGLNGSLMGFRSKPPDAVLSELTTLVQRHQVLDVVMVDNILDMGYFSTVLPRLAALGWDVRIHYEIKANLKGPQIAMLLAAGVSQVQPGIESLVSDVLSLMDKGVSAVHNVRTLRDCESVGLTCAWNWLYGFPGETLTTYEPVLQQLPALVHLQPPIGAARICLERFSPHFDNPALGFAERVTHSSYRHVYDLPEADVEDMVYLFDTPPMGLTTEQSQPLHDFVARWTHDYHRSTLRYTDDGTSITIFDRRVGWPERDHRITGRWRVAYLELEHGHTEAGLHRKMSEQDVDIDADELRIWLAELREHGLVFQESDRFVALAVTSDPIKMPPSKMAASE